MNHEGHEVLQGRALRFESFASFVVLLACSAFAVHAATDADAKLIDAAKQGQYARARTLIAQQHADPNARDVDGTTALHWAVRADDLETTQLLIRAGAHAGAANRYGVTPLSLAAINGNAGAIAALVKAGADPNTATPGGETALMTAARTGRVDAVRVLLELGANVNAREGSFGETALMWAAAEDHPDVTRLLVNRGADVNARSDLVDLPKVKVDLATMVTTALARGGLTPLMFAARQGSVSGARALAAAGANLNLTDPDGMSALVIAIINGHNDVAAGLLDQGADPNVADSAGMAALYAAVDMHTADPLINRPPTRVGGNVDGVDIVKRLLVHGAHPDGRLKAPLLARQHNSGDPNLGEGATPLMRAARSGDLALMRVLLEAGSDVSLATRAGTTPLLFATGPARRKSDKTAIEAIRLCLDKGADINAANANGETALHLAVTQADTIVSFLAERGARLDLKDRQGRTPLDVAMGVGDAGGGRGARGRGPAGPRESTVALLRQLMARP
jgi:ankyrin repeat protein